MPLFLSRSTWFCSLLLACCACGAWAQDDDLPPPAGLIARYETSSHRGFERLEALPAMALAEHESPDSRLTPHDWTATWRGLIDIQQPGSYRFAADASGPVQITIAGQQVLATAGASDGNNLGNAADLLVGYHPVEIVFQPAAGPARLKLYWESSAFAREPMPPAAFRHARDIAAPADLYFAGRLAVEEHNCKACHQPAGDLPLSQLLAGRMGPRLDRVGQRVDADWFYGWLGNPQQFRPEAVMPRLFADTAQGRFERTAASRLLASLGGPFQATAITPDAARVAVGKSLFERSGCAVCHERQEIRAEVFAPPRATLQLLASKTDAAHLAAFIADPYLHDPTSRMPRLGLEQQECQQIAEYLISRDASPAPAADAPLAADELPAQLADYRGPASQQPGYAALGVDDKLLAIGRDVIRAKRCASCHDFGESRNKDLAPVPLAIDFGHIAQSNQLGCLIAAAAPDDMESSAPRFGASLDRAAIKEFLVAARSASGAAAPGELARLTLARFHCASCHQRGDDGGLSLTQTRLLTENQTNAEAELVRPPTLTGIVAKLRPAALHAVLVEGARSRPWMALKMPHFPRELIEPLPARLAALDGDRLAASDPPNSAAADLADAGRELTGNGGFGCIKCHDIRGLASGGTRGPDLARVTRRVNFDWYVRWMRDPQRIEPGTRMPTVFVGGKSPYHQVLDGDPARQARALWEYFAAGDELQLPDGLELAGARQRLAGAQPLVLRTFLPELPPRALAIRFPSGVHLSYDVQACRPGYAWRGEFLDMGPVWSGRGGRPAGIEGEIFWRWPAGFDWALTTDAESLPDFAARASDPIFGAQPPDDGQIHQSRVRFGGYRLAADGPTLMYSLEGDDAGALQVEEAPRTRQLPEGTAVVRRFRVAIPAGRALWLRAAESEAPPVARINAEQIALAADQTADRDARVELVAAGGRALTWLSEADAEAPRWHSAKQGERWTLALVFSPREAPREASFALVLVRPDSSDPAALERWQKASGDLIKSLK